MREPTRLLLVRHGRTAWNLDGRIQGHTDVPLDALGRWQAARVAAALADLPLAAVYASDLQRAAATAEPLARAQGLALRLDAGLRERGFGRYEGRRFADIAVEAPEDAARWRSREPGFAPGGGESLRDFSARCLAALARLAGAHAGEAIAVVTHGGVLDCVHRAATGQALDAPRCWTLDNAALHHVLHTGEGFTLLAWGLATHLEGSDAAPAPG